MAYNTTIPSQADKAERLITQQAENITHLLEGIQYARKFYPLENYTDKQITAYMLGIYNNETNLGEIGNAVSHAGAEGGFQVMPGTLDQVYGQADFASIGLPKNSFDARTGAFAGSFYYMQQLARFDDPAEAAAAYNTGPERGALSGANGAGTMNFAALPGETKGYVNNFNRDVNNFLSMVDELNLVGAGPTAGIRVQPRAISDLYNKLGEENGIANTSAWAQDLEHLAAFEVQQTTLAAIRQLEQNAPEGAMQQALSEAGFSAEAFQAEMGIVSDKRRADIEAQKEAIENDESLSEEQRTSKLDELYQGIIVQDGQWYDLEQVEAGGQTASAMSAVDSVYSSLSPEEQTALIDRNAEHQREVENYEKVMKYGRDAMAATDSTGFSEEQVMLMLLGAALAYANGQPELGDQIMERMFGGNSPDVNYSPGTGYSRSVFSSAPGTPGGLDVRGEHNNGLVLTLPMSGTITSLVGDSRGHDGVDIAKGGNPEIYAAAPGEVIYAGTASGYGNLIKIRHADGSETRYAHLSGFNVQVGDKVGRDTVIGREGNTGRSSGDHLHFEYRDPSGQPRIPVFAGYENLDLEGARQTGSTGVSVERNVSLAAYDTLVAKQEAAMAAIAGGDLKGKHLDIDTGQLNFDDNGMTLVLAPTGRKSNGVYGAKLLVVNRDGEVINSFNTINSAGGNDQKTNNITPGYQTDYEPNKPDVNALYKLGKMAAKGYGRYASHWTDADGNNWGIYMEDPHATRDAFFFHPTNGSATAGCIGFEPAEAARFHRFFVDAGGFRNFAILEQGVMEANLRNAPVPEIEPVRVAGDSNKKPNTVATSALPKELVMQLIAADFDGNGDGVISQEETEAVVGSPRNISNVVAALNKSGVSIAEGEERNPQAMQDALTEAATTLGNTDVTEAESEEGEDEEKSAALPSHLNKKPETALAVS